VSKITHQKSNILIHRRLKVNCAIVKLVVFIDYYLAPQFSQECNFKRVAFTLGFLALSNKYKIVIGKVTISSYFLACHMPRKEGD